MDLLTSASKIHLKNASLDVPADLRSCNSGFAEKAYSGMEVR